MIKKRYYLAILTLLILLLSVSQTPDKHDFENYSNEVDYPDTDNQKDRKL